MRGFTQGGAVRLVDSCPCSPSLATILSPSPLTASCLCSDPALFDMLYRDTGKAVSEVSKSDISHRFDLHMVEYYAILTGADATNEDAASTAKFSKGPMPSIEVSIELRQGKKQMTKYGTRRLTRAHARAHTCCATPLSPCALSLTCAHP